MRIIFIPDSPAAWIVIAAVLALIAGVVIYQWLRPPAWKKLAQDDRYRHALAVYAEAVGREDQLCDVRRQALDSATEYLVTGHGIPAAEAAPNLRRVVAEYARERSYELRNEAVAYEQEGAYDLAMDLYQRAAWWQEHYDPKDYQFLQKCVARVRGKVR
jgi:hypothetical protein